MSLEHDDKELEYALLLGQGRSGTNLLLALLDQSSLTHCRNEPDQLEGGSLARLRPHRFFVEDEDELESSWDAAVTGAALRTGPRDHVLRRRKDWLYPGTRALSQFYLRHRYLVAHRVAGTGKPMDGRELEFPIWATSPARLRRALHVFKLNSACGLASWVFGHRSSVRTLHIVRHPGGFARSWRNRWEKGEGGQERAEAHKDQLQDEERLRELARRDPAWERRMGDIDAMSRMEAELWWWRYVNERIHRDGARLPSYRHMTFEALTAEPVPRAREAYAFLGLPWSEELASRAAQIAGESHKVAAAWRDELEPDEIEIVERILERSELAGFWEA